MEQPTYSAKFAIYMYTFEQHGTDKPKQFYAVLNAALSKEDRGQLVVWFLFIKLLPQFIHSLCTCLLLFSHGMHQVFNILFTI